MRLSFSAAGCLILALTGCSLNTTAVPTPEAGTALRGVARGGQQPISGMHVYLLAANTTGYGNASISLLSAASTGGSDSLGAYVLSGLDGSFSITGDYTCTPGMQVYLYGLGGNPGAGVNASAGLMATLGNCPAAGNFVSATPYIVMNEVSTVAGAYAMAGFATDPTHVSSSGTAQALVGVSNAFANAANLETLSTGTALATTPSGNGTVPQAEINTLADVLAACVNTDGTGTPCLTLFSATTPNGGSAPTDTAQAAINIAHSPAKLVNALYALATPGAPFQPTLSAVPNEWTVALKFSVNLPIFNLRTVPITWMAIDADGNIWMASSSIANFELTKLTNRGDVLLDATANSFPGEVNQIAIDPMGNVWVPADWSGLYKLSNSGSVLFNIPSSQIPLMTLPYNIAIDGGGNAWIVNLNTPGLFKLANDGTVLSPYGGFSTTGAQGTYGRLLVDAAEDVWLGGLKYDNSGTVISSLTRGGLVVGASGELWSAGQDSLSEVSSTGAVLSPTNGFPTCVPAAVAPQVCAFAPGAPSEPLTLAVDGSDNVWSSVYFYGPQIHAYQDGIAGISNTGTILSGTFGYYTFINYYPSMLQVDSSGNLWGASPAWVVELVGVATPTVTPLSLAVQLNKIGSRP